jgi:hypothetical protein
MSHHSNRQNRNGKSLNTVKLKTPSLLGYCPLNRALLRMILSAKLFHRVRQRLFKLFIVVGMDGMAVLCILVHLVQNARPM